MDHARAHTARVQNSGLTAKIPRLCSQLALACSGKHPPRLSRRSSRSEREQWVPCQTMSSALVASFELRGPRPFPCSDLTGWHRVARG